MNVRLLYIYVALVIATVIMSVVVWLIPSSKDSRKSANLQQYFNIQKIQLNSGGSGFLSNNTNSEVVALKIIFKGGTTLEPLNKKGISSILSSMLLNGGSSSNNTNEIKRLLKKYSIEFNISDSLDRITFDILTTKSNVNRMFEILELVLTHTNFSNSALKVVKDNALLGLKLEEHYTNVQANKALYKAIFNNNPHFVNMSGTKESINSITTKDLINTRNILLTKSNIIIGASGNITKAKLESGLNKAFSKLSKGKPINFSDNKLTITKKFINIPVKGSTNSDIYVVMPAPSIIDNKEPNFTGELVNTYMGRGFNSLLVEEVRVKRGLVYYINSSLHYNLYGGFWLIKATTANDKVKDTLNAITIALTELTKKQYTAKDIKNIKQYIEDSYLLSFASNEDIASTLADSAFSNYEIDDIYNANLDIRKTTRKNMDNVIDKYINPNNLTIIVAGAKI